jgi:carboxylesterase
MTTIQSQSVERKRRPGRRRWLQALAAGLVLLIVVALALFWPITYHPSVSSRPARSYDEAVARLAALQARDEGLALYPGCESQVMTHEQKTERVMVLLHGYRNCPAQLQQLGLIFYEQGYNVIIPRMPHHGLADALNHDQARLTSDELAAHVTEAVDIAQGLGEQVTMVGMSTGGIMAGWVAQNRTDIAQAVLIAPFFSPYTIPAQLVTPAINLFTLLPNFFLWQDDKLKADVPNPPQAYPRNSTWAVSQILRLSFAVRNQAGQAAPAAPRILVVTNANDDTVDNQVTAGVLADWRKHGFSSLQTYEFAADLHLDHDMLDPAHPKQKIALVYPVLIDLIAGH